MSSSKSKLIVSSETEHTEEHPAGNPLVVYPSLWLSKSFKKKTLIGFRTSEKILQRVIFRSVSIDWVDQGGNIC